ncbi:uncharacterized protein LOC125670048 [Ostrea edulis]|uniref:uncharacterized protein LOC125670048 n=1 Tax=Ostrea edulis TaxID=37623 RepID=UPI0024AEFB0F|nr:uncharacterized protein LOC125670048 [Ostrea edulis]
MFTTKPTSINDRDTMCRKNKKDMNLKFIVVGDSGIGKTTLVESYCLCHGKENISRSNNLLYYQHTISNKDGDWNLKIFDTAGQERYRSVTSSYYRGAQGAIIAFDLSQETSFVNLENWYNDMLNVCSSSEISVTLLGIQRESREKVVSTDRAQKFAEYLDLPYVEVSLNLQTEINEVFDNLAKTVVQRIQSREPVASMSTLTTTNLSRLVIKAESKVGCNCC